MSSSVLNSEGGGDGDSGDSVLTPSTFYHIRKNLTYSASFSRLRLLTKNLRKQKIVTSVNVKKIKAKKYKTGFEIAYDEAATIFYQNWSKIAKVGGFLTAAEAFM